jgi:hypothetical protein
MGADARHSPLSVSAISWHSALGIYNCGATSMQVEIEFCGM